MSGKKPLIQDIENAQLKTDVPEFGAGDTVIVNVPIDNPSGIGARYEVGLTTGTSEPWRHLKNLVKAPRLGLSYRFGEGTSSVRFVISTRY